MRRGLTLAEVLVAGGLTLMLLTLAATQTVVFWQAWQDVNAGLHQRQWAVVAFEFLDRDMRQAVAVTLGESLVISGNEGNVSYRVTAEGSLYRRQGNTFYALAYEVCQARWWVQDRLLWVELEFYDQSKYCTGYPLPLGP